MPRHRRSPRVPDAADGVGLQGVSDPRVERAAVFERTKMCKFYILGACTKGASCHFAHTKDQLKGLPDLARTKLCKSLINTGQCDDPACMYAHTKEEIRPAPVPDAIPKRQQRRLIHDVGFGQPHHQPQVPQQPMQQLLRRPQQFQLQQQQQPQQLQQQQQQLPQQQQSLQVPRPQQAMPQMMQGSGIPPPGSPLLVAAPAPMQCAIPAMPCLMSGQDVAMGQVQYSSLLQQMGQAAQAHAFEAAMLQAMMAQMQANAGGTAPAATLPTTAPQLAGGLAGTPMMPFLPGAATMTAQLMPQMGGLAIPAMMGTGPCAMDQSAAKGEIGLPTSPPRAQPQAKQVAAPAPTPSTATEGDRAKGGASAISQALSKEPVQINTNTLRSVSSNSICRMATGADEDEELAQLQAPEPPAARGPPPEKRSQDTPFAPPTEGKHEHHSSDTAFDTSTMRIKNTFYDFPSGAPPTGALRAVRTAGGRLDLMGRQASGNSLDTWVEDE